LVTEIFVPQIVYVPQVFTSDVMLMLVTVEPRFNEPLFNEVLDRTNNILCHSQSYSKMYGIEPRYNEFCDIANIFRKPKRKNYLDIANANVNTRQKINAGQINCQQSFNPYGKETATFQTKAYYVTDIGTIVFR